MNNCKSLSSLNEKVYHSDKFDDEYVGVWGNRIQKILSLVEKKHKIILDVGCGNGRIAEMIGKKFNAKMFGVDLVKENVSEAKKKGIIAVRCDLNLEKLPFPKNHFDLVCCTEVLEHLYDTENALREIGGVLKKKGELILTVPNLASWYNRGLLLNGNIPAWIELGTKKAYGSKYAQVFGHLRPFTKKALVEILEDNGFAVKKIEGVPMDLEETAKKGKCTRAEMRLFNFVEKIFSRKTSMASTLLVKAVKI